ncbi:hypothetical protein CR513_62228, partial [Mucuna pruriens]
MNFRKKKAKEKSLEEKVVQLLHNHEEQSDQIRQQNEKMEQQNQQMQLILQHLQLKSLMPPPTTPDNNDDHGS